MCVCLCVGYINRLFVRGRNEQTQREKNAVKYQMIDNLSTTTLPIALFHFHSDRIELSLHFEYRPKVRISFERCRFDTFRRIFFPAVFENCTTTDATSYSSLSIKSDCECHASFYSFEKEFQCPYIEFVSAKSE